MKFSPLQKLNVLVLALAICIFLAPKSSFAAPSKLVIDEFRISGENSNDEYVVIANYGTAPQSLNGYRLLKRAKSTTDYKLIDNFGDFILNPGQKIVAAHAKYVGARDFTFVTGTSNTIADSNSIFLVAPDKSTMDLVGYGDAIFYEGTPTLAPSVGEVYSRVGGKDTDDNKADFVSETIELPADPNAGRLVISELLPNPTVGEEWFELFNPTSLSISLANLKICDTLGVKHCYYFDKNDFLSAGVYKTYGQSLTKITLNNSGDWLELYDLADNLITDSGGNYGAADKGVSFSLFGSEYLWTKTLTPGAQNIFTDTIEVEPEATAKPKTAVKKASIAKKKTTDTAQLAEADVKGAESPQMAADSTQKPMMNRKILGWSLIGLAVLLVISYTLWYFRDYAKNIYDKIRHRDDSARF